MKDKLSNFMFPHNFNFDGIESISKRRADKAELVTKIWIDCEL